MADYDRGDEDIDEDALFEAIDNEYWDPGEDDFVNGHKDDMAKELFKSIFGKDLDTIVMDDDASDNDDDASDNDEDASGKHKSKNIYSDDDGEDGEEVREDPEKFMAGVDRHMEAWLENNKDHKKGKDLPPIRIEDDGSDPTTMQIIDDPVWRKRVEEKEAPRAYWEEFVKGRKAWEKKYIPGISHGGRHRVYLHTPEGPLERVPAWATYILPGKHERTIRHR